MGRVRGESRCGLWFAEVECRRARRGAVEITHDNEKASFGVGQARGLVAKDRAGEGESGGPEETVVVDVPQAMLDRAEGEAEPGGPTGDERGEGADGEAEGAGGQGGIRAGPSVSGIGVRRERGEGGKDVAPVAGGGGARRAWRSSRVLCTSCKQKMARGRACRR